jgi:hypothetical protein
MHACGMIRNQSSLSVRIRRLSRTDGKLYVQFVRRELEDLSLEHGVPVTMTIDGGCQLEGVVKTTGSVCWLAPGERSSNASITVLLEEHGYAHGHDTVGAVVT